MKIELWLSVDEKHLTALQIEQLTKRKSRLVPGELIDRRLVTAVIDNIDATEITKIAIEE